MYYFLTQFNSFVSDYEGQFHIIIVHSLSVERGWAQWPLLKDKLNIDIQKILFMFHGLAIWPHHLPLISSTDLEMDFCLCSDPDAPSRANPKFGEWHHWLVTNIPGSDLSQADTMSEYVGAGPPPDTGLHRYVFLLFKQPSGKQSFEGLSKLTNRSMDGRPKWKVREFSDKYGLGQAVAGNFFHAEYDDYCPKLYEQLKG